MDVTRGLEILLAVFIVAALAPLVTAVLPGPRIPQVVFFLIGGVVIGPHALGLADSGSVQLVANGGLGFLFLLAGYELDPALLRQRPGRLGIVGWLVSVVLSVAITAALAETGFVRDPVPIALALTTTALGTLLPILHENGMLRGEFGRYVFAAGAVGELFPILAIALFLTQGNHFAAILSVVGVGLLAVALSAVPFLARSERLKTIIAEGQNATSQIVLRWSVVLLFLLLVIASHFGLDVVLGAMLAGMVLRGWTRRLGIDVSGLEQKFDAVGYGIFIPVFFVASGMSLDIAGIAHNPLRQRVEMTFITATALPLLVALAEIGLQDGRMLPGNAAALVGADVLSVLIYPAVAAAIAKQDPRPPGPAGLPPQGRAAADGMLPPDL